MRVHAAAIDIPALPGCGYPLGRFRCTIAFILRALVVIVIAVASLPGRH